MKYVTIICTLFLLASLGCQEDTFEPNVKECLEEDIPFDTCQGNTLIEYTGDISEFENECTFEHTTTDCEFSCKVVPGEDDVCSHPCDDFDLTQCEVDSSDDRCQHETSAWMTVPRCTLNWDTPEPNDVMCSSSATEVECEEDTFCIDDENGVRCE